MDRPSTSKARGVCRFFSTSRGCREATKCKFLHDHPTLTPFDQAKTCKFYAAGFCSRGDQCWFKHVKPGLTNEEPVTVTGPTDEADEPCSICYEIPTTFGLLTGCNHIFCINCLRDWRSPSGKSEDLISSQSIKKCPLCREPSRYCVPSSIFYAQGSAEKDHAIDMYRASMARVPCKYFKVTARRPHCPFGDECFYQHANLDGTRHHLGYGLNNNRRRRHDPNLLLTFEQQLLGLEELFRGAHNPAQDLQATMTHIRDGLPAVTDSIERDGSDPEAARELGDMANRLVASLSRVIGLRETSRANRRAPARPNVARDDWSDRDSITPSESASQAGLRLSRPGSPSAGASAPAPGPADANPTADRMHMVWDMVSDGPLHTFPPLPLDTTGVDVDAEARVAELEHAIMRHNIEQLRLNEGVTATAIRDVGGTPAASTSRPSRFSTTVAGRMASSSAPGSPEAPLERTLQRGWRPLSALEQTSPASGGGMPELVPLSDSDSEAGSSLDDYEEVDQANLAPEDGNATVNDVLLHEALAFMSANPSMLFRLHGGQQDSDSDDDGPPPLEPISTSDPPIARPDTLQRADTEVMTAAVDAANARAEALNIRTDALIALADAMLHNREEHDQERPAQSEDTATLPTVASPTRSNTLRAADVAVPLVPAPAAVEDEWEAQQVPYPPFSTDGRGKVVFANPEAVHEYSERRRRHGRT